MKTSNAKQPVVSQIIIRQPQRKTANVGLWRAAMKSADMGRVKELYDFYEDLLIDGRLGDAVDKRISAVTNSPITFQNAEGEAVDAITALIDTPAFEDLLTIIMQRRFWGRSGIEFDFSNGFNVYDIPKKHIDLQGKQILISEGDSSGIPYEADDNILVLGQPRDLGLFLKTAPYVIWKRGGFGDYAQWLEIFGMPQRVGKYSAFDTESRKLLEKALSEAGSAPWCVIPKETDVETVNNTGNGSSGTSYDEFRKACNEEMTITILGQTLTTVQGDKGARSLGEVHKQVEEGKNRADMRYVQRVLNYSVLPLLEKRGYPVKGGQFLFPEAAEALSVSDVVALCKLIDIPADFLHKKYSIPMPKDGELIAGSKNAPEPKTDTNEPIEPIDPNAPEEEDDQEPVKDEKPKPGDPKGKKPKGLKNHDRNIFLQLWDFFASAPAVMTGATQTGAPLTLRDDTLEGKVISAITGSTTFNAELFEYISQDLIKAIEWDMANLADLGFTYGFESDAYRTAQEMNVFRFSAAKSMAEITELNRLYRESTSFDEFYKKALEVTDTFNKKWQKTEYETANLLTLSTQNYDRLIKKTKLFPFWEYRTVGDDKVRPEHARLHGVILAATDPLWAKIWPPNGWKCRCYVVPRMTHEVKGVDITDMRRRVNEYLTTSEWKMVQAQGFGVNRALSPEVFTEDQMYIKKFPDRAAKLLKDINYRTYKVGTVEQNRASALTDWKAYEGTAQEFLGTLKSENNRLFMTDYKNRSIMLDDKKLLESTKTDDERIRFMQSASETVKAPDEVWITTEGKLSQYAFIKYYKDLAVCVLADIDKQVVYRVRTWFPINEFKAAIDYRSGLLIKKRQ